MIPQLKSIFNQNQLTQLINLFTQRTSASLSLKEDVANKQDSLTPDGTGVKYPTVDAVNAAGFATETYADIAAAGAEAAANSYTDGVVATKQNVFDYSVTETGGNLVTIDGVSGGVAEFTDVVAKNSFAVFKINSDLFLAKSKIIYSLNYNGNGYPVILSYKIALGQVTFQVANISTTLDTSDNIVIEYQIVG